MENIYIPTPHEKLTIYVEKLIKDLPELNAAIISSDEGLPLAAALPNELDERRVAAMSAVISSVSESAIEEMRLGSLKQVHIKGKDGLFMLFSAGKSAVLTVSTSVDITQKLGLILLDCERTCEKISKLYK